MEFFYNMFVDKYGSINDGLFIIISVFMGVYAILSFLVPFIVIIIDCKVSKLKNQLATAQIELDRVQEQLAFISQQNNNILNSINVSNGPDSV